MIDERIIEQAEDGTYYSLNAVTLEYNDIEKKHTTLFYLDPEQLYQVVHGYILELSQTKIDESNPLKKRLTQLMRASIKGMLIAFGDDLLTLIYGTKDHEKPGKKDNIVDWYQDQFARIAIAHMMKNDIVLDGEISSEGEHKTIISVSGFTTRPVTIEKK